MSEAAPPAAAEAAPGAAPVSEAATPAGSEIEPTEAEATPPPREVPAPPLAEPGAVPADTEPQPPTRGRRGRERAGGARSNALGILIERRFADPRSPVRSYSELERRSGISREALSRYVTPRADRRRSPTIDTLAAIADAMHLSLEQVSRAAVASAHGASLPSESVQQARDEVVAPLMATLTADQFSAIVELLRQMQPSTRETA